MKSSTSARGMILLFFCCLLHWSCHRQPETIKSTFVYREPNYNQEQIFVTSDTLSFPLDTSTYNFIKTFNYFTEGGKEYISFYDRRSQSVNIYDFRSGILMKKVLLEVLLANLKLNNTTVFVKNRDSMFISNELTLYLVGRSGHIQDSIDLQTDPYVVRASFDHTNPPFFENGILYCKARPYLKTTRIKDLRRWKVLYSIDIRKAEANLYYNLPERYREDIYGLYFMDCSYCNNEKGNFVFSFPADPNIYETDLEKLHNAYYGKSRFQKGEIPPVDDEELHTAEEMEKSYLFRDTYRAIYFDPRFNRYLRIARFKISDKDYLQKKWDKEQSIIIFNSSFEVIGESVIDKSVSLSSLFLTKESEIYARTNLKDDYAIHFVRLAYSKDSADHRKLADLVAE